MSQPHSKGCWFCLFQKLLVIFGFAAIGIVCIIAGAVDAIHFHYLSAARGLVGYFIAIVGIEVVPKLLDQFHGLMDRVGL